MIEDWLAPVGELGRRVDVPERDADAYARLGLAVARGLLLDLVTTGDVEAVNNAMDLFITGMAPGA